MAYVITDTLANALADAIKEKTGLTSIVGRDMPDAILSISGDESEYHTFDQRRAEVADYIEEVTYNPSDYTTTEITDYYTGSGLNNNYPVGCPLTIKEAGKLVLTDRMTGIVYEKNVTAGAYTVYNLTPGKSHPFAVIVNNEAVQSGMIHPTGACKMIRARDTNIQMFNVRDLGGWACDGGTVRYGKIIRGCRPVDNAAVEDIMVNQLGIRAELDLRLSSEAGISESPWDGVEYFNFNGNIQYNLTNVSWYNVMKTVFDCVKDGKPLYFGCAEGADRTGTLACIIEGLLGVSQSDCDKDYELTSFYSGIDTASHLRARNEADWTGLITAINSKTGTSFRDKIVAFVASLGFTAADINAFRHSMIDGNPQDITVVGTYYSVTGTYTHCSTNNNAAEVLENREYNATITFASGYEYDSATVTMGGTDITSTAYSNGTIHIASVTGNVVITVTGKEAKQYSGNIVDTVGYTDNNRYSTSSGNMSAQSGYVAIHEIAFAYPASGEFRIKVTGVNDHKDANCTYVLTDGNGVKKTSGYFNTQYEGSSWGHTWDSEASYIYFKSNSGINGIKFSAYGVGADAVITQM